MKVFKLFLLLSFLIFCQLLSVAEISSQDGTTTTTSETTTSTTTIEFTTTTTTLETTTTTIPTCGISADNIIFGSVNSGEISSEKTVTITNTGNTETTSLTIKGADWTPSPSMPVGQTHWYLTAGQTYGLMNALTTSDNDLGEEVGPETPLPVYFKLKIPQGQPQGSYSQTITLTGGC